MSFQYDFQTLKEAILFNTVEVLPSNNEQLDQEIHTLVDNANSSGEPIRHYIGFEISGQIHIGTGIMSALKIKKLQDAGVKCNLFLADYHTYLNEKLDGKMETIRQVANDYFGPVMLKCCEIVGCNVAEIDLVLAEKEYEKKPNGHNYLSFYLKIAKEITLSRVLKSVSVMGKSAGESVDFGTLCYPIMQVADAFFMQTHLVHAGLDQRKCHVLMRETATKLDENYSLKIGQKQIKPIAIHHSLLLGIDKPVGGDFKLEDFDNKSPTLERSLEILSNESQEITLENEQKILEHDETVIRDVIALNLEAQNKAKEVNKMSKSKPDSAIWVHDSFDEILRKLKKAYCPMPEAELSEKLKLEIVDLQTKNPSFALILQSSGLEITTQSEQNYQMRIIQNFYQQIQKSPIYGQIKAQQEWNPMLDWCKKMIFPGQKFLEVKRPERFGGDKVYENFESLELDYFVGNLHPLDLKTAVTRCLADWFLPIWEFVQSKPEILELVKNARK